MEELEIVLIGLVVVSIVLIFFSFFLVLRDFQTNKEIQTLKIQKSKSRQKRKKSRQIVKELEKSASSRVKKIIFLFVLSIGLAIGSYFLKSYMATSMTAEDNDTLVKAYYLVRNFEDQIGLAATESDEQDKVARNINYLATTMASYGIYQANYLNSEEGQLVVNKYYNAIMELGVNNTTISGNFYGNEALATETQEDIERIKTYEKKVFAYYKIDESLLKQQ